MKNWRIKKIKNKIKHYEQLKIEDLFIWDYIKINKKLLKLERKLKRLEK